MYQLDPLVKLYKKEINITQKKVLKVTELLPKVNSYYIIFYRILPNIFIKISRTTKTWDENWTSKNIKVVHDSNFVNLTPFNDEYIYHEIDNTIAIEAISLEKNQNNGIFLYYLN